MATIKKLTYNPVAQLKMLEPKSAKKIGFNTLEGIHIIDTSNIICCEALGNYTKVHLKDKKSFMVSKTLKLIEEHLPFRQFKRCHNSFIVQINEVLKIHESLEMSNGIIVPISRRKKKEVKGWFSEIVSFI